MKRKAGDGQEAKTGEQDGSFVLPLYSEIDDIPYRYIGAKAFILELELEGCLCYLFNTIYIRFTVSLTPEEN